MFLLSHSVFLERLKAFKHFIFLQSFKGFNANNLGNHLNVSTYSVLKYSTTYSVHKVFIYKSPIFQLV